ncbi:SOS response-associated peptidase family protein [Allosphingosinicella sp.]|jgi:putative SOS response-associated peptidase YedK|uniref:SOS response-associated peptidase family protein n=1 Tax=Allosphingosinicella sp. TaxID=2823234 RepID=UPI002F04E8F7
MCNEYRRHVALGEIVETFAQLRIPLRFPEGAPNLGPVDSIRITDRAAIVRAAGGEGEGEGAQLVQRRWSWPAPNGKPVYNLRSEGRGFTMGRCLIPADGFYEFTDPVPPPGELPQKRARKDKWLFTLPGAEWFCIAGMWRGSAQGEAFAMLTGAPGPDVAPYHGRQIVVLPRRDWSRWLDPAVPAQELLGPSPAGTFNVAQVL